MPTIRAFQPDDVAAISDVCLRTGHAGQDAGPYYPDPDLLSAVFARPYLAVEPELAYVAVDGGRAVGYILGTADTAGFVAWFRRTWLPALADRYPPPTAPRHDADTLPSWPDVMTAALHRPERMLRPELAAHPAHLHMNLLPSHQRRGLGRRLMTTFLGALDVRGVPAVHVAHGKFNISARVFYKKVGFELLTVADPDPVRYLGRSTRISATHGH